MLNGTNSFATAVVGVAELDAALSFWVEQLGFEVVATREGEDKELARLWDVSESEILRQALVRTPEHEHGMIHFVQFDRPESPVRLGSNAFDACPKNLDVYVEDMPAQIELLRSQGWRFKSETYSEIATPDGTTVREMHLPVHDNINVVLLQVLEQPMSFSSRGFCGVGPLVTTVMDEDAEIQFYDSVLGLQLLHQSTLNGGRIERSVGLPSGAGLIFSVLGSADAMMGRIEVVSYKGVVGDSLYARARPKALGILHVSYHVEQIVDIEIALDQFGARYRSYGLVDTLAGRGETIAFEAPSGFRIEAMQLEDQRV